PADASGAGMKAAEAALTPCREGAAGPLRVASYQSVSPRGLPALIRRFREAWPKVDVRLTEAGDEELETLLERGSVDLSFVMLPVQHETLAADEVLVDPSGLIGR